MEKFLILFQWYNKSNFGIHDTGQKEQFLKAYEVVAWHAFT